MYTERLFLPEAKYVTIFSNYNWKNCMQLFSFLRNIMIILQTKRKEDFFSIILALISLTILTNCKLFSSFPTTSYSSHLSLISANSVHAIILVELLLFRRYVFQQEQHHQKIIIGLTGISSFLWNYQNRPLDSFILSPFYKDCKLIPQIDQVF